MAITVPAVKRFLLVGGVPFAFVIGLPGAFLIWMVVHAGPDKSHLIVQRDHYLACWADDEADFGRADDAGEPERPTL